MIKCMRKYKGYKDNKKKRENARNSCGVALETYIHKRKIKHIRKDETWFLYHIECLGKYKIRKINIIIER